MLKFIKYFIKKIMNLENYNFDYNEKEDLKRFFEENKNLPENEKLFEFFNIFAKNNWFDNLTFSKLPFFTLDDFSKKFYLKDSFSMEWHNKKLFCQNMFYKEIKEYYNEVFERNMTYKVENFHWSFLKYEFDENIIYLPKLKIVYKFFSDRKFKISFFVILQLLLVLILSFIYFLDKNFSIIILVLIYIFWNFWIYFWLKIFTNNFNLKTKTWFLNFDKYFYIKFVRELDYEENRKKEIFLEKIEKNDFLEKFKILNQKYWEIIKGIEITFFENFVLIDANKKLFLKKYNKNNFLKCYIFLKDLKEILDILEKNYLKK